MTKPRLRALSPLVRVIDVRTTPTPEKKADRFYLSPAWRKLIAEIIEERGRRCEDAECKSPDLTNRRAFGDHVIELQDGGAPLDKANVMIRCGSCHTRKTIAERNKRMQG